MYIHPYFSDIADGLNRGSNQIREYYKTHNPSAGENREDLVADFLSHYLPPVFAIDTGLILSSNGRLANQADILIYDKTYNFPLFPQSSNKFWLIESVYALIEVKTRLETNEIRDAITKCRNFKTLPRYYSTNPKPPISQDSLCIIWGFEGPKPETVLSNIRDLLKDVPVAEQPDIIIIPNSLVITAGSYRQAIISQKPSRVRYTMTDSQGRKREFSQEPIAGWQLGNNALLASLIWITEWLKNAGNRSPMLSMYIDPEAILGQEIYIPGSQNLDWTY